MARYKTFTNGGDVFPADLNSIQDWLDGRVSTIETTGINVATAAATNPIVQGALTADTTKRVTMTADGKLSWGPGGTTAPDANLYRVSAGIVRTDNSLAAGTRFSAGGVIDTTYVSRVYGNAKVDGNLYLSPSSYIVVGGSNELSYMASGAFHIFRSAGSSGTADGDIYYRNSFPTSDVNQKENVVDITGALAKVRQLRGVTFDWIGTQRASMGLIAQDVQSIFPEAVQALPLDEPDATPVLGLSYESLIGPLVEAVKELAATVDSQAAAIAALQNPTP